MPSALHDAAMQLYRQYLIVGGMPECVMQFAETKDYILVRHTQDTILASYLNDMSKYNNMNGIKKTQLAYDNITVQLSRKNTRFQYKLIKKGGRASEFENAIEWLCLSGIVSQVYKVEQIKKPLENYRDIDAFKIYVSDLGLLCAKKDLAANDILYMTDELNDFKGGMTENYVNVQLNINGYKNYYWESERGAEIDFIIQRDGHLIPIEVKSADNTRAKSLRVYMDTYKPAEKPMSYGGNNHGSIVEIRGKWYIFYHRHTDGTNFSRQGCIEPISFREDGSIVQAEITSCGANGGPLEGKGEYPAYLACHLFTGDEAFTTGAPGEWMDCRFPKITQDGRDGDEETGYIANMRDGAHAGFKYFACKGISRVSIRVRGYCKGAFGVKTAWDGPVLGWIPVEFSNEWKEYGAAIAIPDGVQALYFVYQGDGGASLASFCLE